MIRAAILALPLILAACGTPDTDSYSLTRGSLTYDELNRETLACQAKGGTIKPKDQSGDPAQLSNYTCVVPKGRP